MAIAELFSADINELEVLAMSCRSRLSVSLTNLSDEQSALLVKLAKSVRSMNADELKEFQQILSRIGK